MNNLAQKSQRQLVRANKALRAAKTLLENQLYEDCLSRTYYAVMHAAKEDRQKVSIEICGELIRKMKDCCRGAHLMTLGWDHCVPDIIEAAS